MKKIVNVFEFMFDVSLSLVLYPVLYMTIMIYLLYGSIRYKSDFKEDMKDLNKTYIGYIMNGLKIHKEWIMGV